MCVNTRWAEKKLTQTWLQLLRRPLLIVSVSDTVYLLRIRAPIAVHCIIRSRWHHQAVSAVEKIQSYGQPANPEYVPYRYCDETKEKI